MQPETFIFIGKSGCGKGTQAEFLMNSLKEKDQTKEIFYLESGQRFRDFIAEGSTWASQLAKEVNMTGGLQPEFLAVWVWADLMIKNLKGGEHLVLDGVPRKLHEAPVLLKALRFFRREKINVIFINVSDEWATERMMERQRGDDKKASIEKRLGWYKTDVAPVVEYYRTHEDYHFIEINGEQGRDKVHEDILKAIW